MAFSGSSVFIKLIILGIQSGVHTIIESHPENIFDFRFNEPWPELIEYVSKFDFAKMDAMASSHTPFVVLILSAMSRWKEIVMHLYNIAEWF